MDEDVPITSVTGLQTAVRAALADSSDAVGPIRVICDACGPLMSVDGASITVSTPAGARDTVYASDEAIAHLEQLEFTLGEGPAQQAYATRRPVLVADLNADLAADWPVLASSLAGSPIAAIFAFPLQYGSAGAGTMTLYRATPGALTSAQITKVLQIADLATMLLIGHPDDPADPGHDENRASSLAMSLPQARARVHQATGILMAEFAMPADQALARLRGHAFRTGRLVDDVAADLVEHRLGPEEVIT